MFGEKGGGVRMIKVQTKWGPQEHDQWWGGGEGECGAEKVGRDI